MLGYLSEDLNRWPVLQIFWTCLGFVQLFDTSQPLKKEKKNHIGSEALPVEESLTVETGSWLSQEFRSF